MSFRVDSLDGDYFGWTRDSKGLEWTRGASFYEKPVEDVIARRGAARATGLAVSTIWRFPRAWSRSPTRG